MSLVRLRRILTTVSAAMLAVLLLGPATGLASVPAGWSLTAVPVVAQVSPGAAQAYKVTIKNTGPSNIAKLYLTASNVSGGLPGTPIAFIQGTLANCDTSINQGCPLGAFPKGRTLHATLVYRVPASGPSPFKIRFEINTTGYVLGSNQSHGDSLPATASTPVNGSSNFVGGYTLDTDPISTGTGDSQQTTVIPPSTGIGVTIQEGGSTNPCSGHPIGQYTVLNVADGIHYSTPFLTTLKISTAGLPDELELSQFKLCHQYDDSSAVFLPQCASDAAPTNGVACFWPKWSGAKAHQDHDKNDVDDWNYIVLDMFDYENGGIRGNY